MQRMKHYDLRLGADPGRVVIRPFHLAIEPRGMNPLQSSRAGRIVSAVLAMTDEECASVLRVVNTDFADRHWQTRRVFLERCDEMLSALGSPTTDDLAEPRRALIGAYFCHEYSYAAAALMNPSVVPHPDQTGLPSDAVRFVLSLRAVGEGHISSIVFREGIFYADGDVVLQPEPPFSVAARVADGLKANDGVVVVRRDRDVSLSGTVLFPMTAEQRNGLEDLRLVRFCDGGSARYIGSYTAFSGAAIRSELLETQDFQTFTMRPLNGDAAKNKGLALFPRRIGGAFAMLGRTDNETIRVLYSHDLANWGSGEVIIAPQFSWDLVQMGNCGAPLEVDEGWLVLTHGVGPMRQYSIGAALLDKTDPSRVLARTAKPMLTPLGETREGYVPNVVYSCGGLVFQRKLFLPYGVADSSVRFCAMDIDTLLSHM
jgi:predicted GH43/DUF377 family glycosyl hydrolase